MAKVKGISDVDTLDMEKMRQTVVEQELSARSWKAMRSKMEDTIAIYAIEDEYEKVVAHNRERIQQRQAEAEEFYKKMNEQLKESGLEKVS